ncbi:MAG: TIR domain-containing protein [Candidatus Tectomicrobia bacterium]|nr:TIR domain-containing protein [Candidatus Tectomicrobia bacterium]
MTAPKLFISYSWSSPDHEQWVADFATELRESGVDVILDKWDLREGHDAIAFMEKMVTDPEVKKVVIVSDRIYAAKADGRAGGVGKETQIISKEVYEKQTQDKFVAVVREKDEEGKPYLPTYYKSRIHIDLSEPETYGANFERLLRWAFDKPLYVKPELGNKPSFLEEGEHVSLGTTVSFRRAIDAIKNNKTYAAGALDEYLNTFVRNLERFRLEKPIGEFDDAVVKNIEEFLPFRNEAIQLFITISQYSQGGAFLWSIHRFFENLIPYMDRPPHISTWRDEDYDNFRFIVHELFLYTLGILIKFECFEQARYMLEQRYYFPGNSESGRDSMVKYLIFHQRTSSLTHRSKRLNRLSVRADLLNERCTGVGIEFLHLMQADFVIFMRAEIESTDDYPRWWPETLLYIRYSRRPFEIFARSISKSYFELVKGLLGITSPTDLQPLLTSYSERRRQLPRWDFDSINPGVLLGSDKLASKS